MATTRGAIVASLVGMAAGFAAGWFAAPRDAAAPVTEPARETSADPAVPAPTAATAPTPEAPAVSTLEPAPPRPAAAAPATDTKVSVTLEDQLRRSLGGEVPAEVAARAKELRDARIATAESTAASQAAREELARRDVRRVEGAGEIARVLDEMASKQVSMTEIAADGERMATLLRHPARGPTLVRDGLSDLGTAVDGTTIRLGTGKFEWPRVRELASALTVEGVGVDKTFIDGDFRGLSGSLVALTVQDVTLTDQDVFDARGELLTLTLRRVRALGFNSGAGGSAFMDVRGSVRVAILAQDSTFDGTGRGGRRHGTVFELPSRANLLRCEDCTFIGVDRIVRDGSSAAFVRCVFRDDAHAHVEGATYKDCVFEGNGDDPK